MHSTVRLFQLHVNSLLLCHFQALSSETMRKKKQALNFDYERFSLVAGLKRRLTIANGQEIVNENQAVSY